uniref:Uncharacterized protein n=1 Tax=Pyrodinium bahamense TaxID=73915 RepID=A0A7S0FIH5_9DINO
MAPHQGQLRPASAKNLRPCKSVVFPFPAVPTGRESKAERELYHRAAESPMGSHFRNAPVRALSEVVGTPTRPRGVFSRSRPCSAVSLKPADATPEHLDSGAAMEVSSSCKLQRRREATTARLNKGSGVATFKPNTQQRVLKLVLALDDASALWVLGEWLKEKPYLLPDCCCALREPRQSEKSAGILEPGKMDMPCGMPREVSQAEGFDDVVIACSEGPKSCSASFSGDETRSSNHKVEQLPVKRLLEVSYEHTSDEEPSSEPVEAELPLADFSGKLNVKRWHTSTVQGWHEIHLGADGNCRWLQFVITNRPPNCRLDEECMKQGTWKVHGSCYADAKAIMLWEDGTQQTETLAGCLAKPDQKWSPAGGWFPC